MLSLKADDGYFRFAVELPAAAGGATETVTVALDSFEALNQYAALCDQFDPVEKANELAAEWVAWLVSKGCPPLPNGPALLVAAHLRDAVAEFKKKCAGAWATAASPGSTAPPASPAP